jgi:glutathione S-transferase
MMGANVDDPTPVLKSILASAHKHLSALNAQLEKTGAWIAGDDFTLADIMTIWNLTTGRQWNSIDLSEYHAILAYLQRISQREGYQRFIAKAEEGLDWKKGLTGPGPDLFGPYVQMLKAMEAAKPA